MVIRTLIFLLFLAAPASAQLPVNIAKDTSFNIPATFNKEKKKRSYISIATPEQSKDVQVATNIVYRTLGDRQLVLDVFYPKNTKKKKKAAVLLIFGGGWKSGDKTHNHAMATELANRNYVAISAEYRLSPEAPYPAALCDLKAAIRWMRANAGAYGIDTGKIVVLGCSAGGQLAALLGSTNNDPRFEDINGEAGYSSEVKAVINIDGILAFHHRESVESTVAAEWLGGTYEQKPETWAEASALNHVGSNTAAFLFINSSIPRFHAGRDDMIRKLDSFHVYSEVHTIEDTPHPFWFFNPWFEPMMGYIVAFLDKQFNS